MSAVYLIRSGMGLLLFFGQTAAHASADADNLRDRYVLSDNEIQSRCGKTGSPSACSSSYKQVRDSTENYLNERRQQEQRISQYQQQNSCSTNPNQANCSDAARKLASMTAEMHQHLADLCNSAAEEVGKLAGDRQHDGSASNDGNSDGNGSNGAVASISSNSSTPSDSATASEASAANAEAASANGENSGTQVAIGNQDPSPASATSSTAGAGASPSGGGYADQFTSGFQDTMSSTANTHNSLAQAAAAGGTGVATASLGTGTGAPASVVGATAAMAGVSGGATGAAAAAAVAKASAPALAAAVSSNSLAPGEGAAAIGASVGATRYPASASSGTGASSAMGSNSFAAAAADTAPAAGAKGSPGAGAAASSDGTTGVSLSGAGTNPWASVMASGQARSDFVNKLASDESFRKSVKQQLKQSQSTGQIDAQTAEFVRFATAQAERQSSERRAGKGGPAKEFSMDAGETNREMSRLLAQNTEAEQEAYLASPSEPLFTRVHDKIWGLLKDGQVKRPLLLQ